jgi:GTPase
MDIVVSFTFTQAWETLNGIEQRLEILGLHADRFPESQEIAAAIGRLMGARDSIREAMSLVDRISAEALVRSLTPGPQDVPVALDTYWNRGA